MNLFKKKETISQNIAFMAIMSCINVVFVLLTTFVPFLLFLLVFILPLSCTLVILLCKKRYFIVYACATIGLCLIVTIWNISDTLFYILPSLITGFVFGILIEKKLSYSYSIIAATIVQFGLSYLLLPLIKMITQVDILSVFSKILGIDGFTYEFHIMTFGVFLVAFMQEIISYVFIRYGLRHLNLQPKEIDNKLINDGIIVINLLLTILFYFIFPRLCYVYFFIAAYFSYFEIVRIIRFKRIINYVLLVLSFFAVLFGFAILYPYIKDPCQLLSFEAYFLVIAIISFINK